MHIEIHIHIYPSHRTEMKLYLSTELSVSLGKAIGLKLSGKANPQKSGMIMGTHINSNMFS